MKTTTVKTHLETITFLLKLKGRSQSQIGNFIWSKFAGYTRQDRIKYSYMAAKQIGVKINLPV